MHAKLRNILPSTHARSSDVPRWHSFAYRTTRPSTSETRHLTADRGGTTLCNREVAYEVEEEELSEDISRVTCLHCIGARLSYFRLHSEREELEDFTVYITAVDTHGYEQRYAKRHFIYTDARAFSLEKSVCGHMWLKPAQRLYKAHPGISENVCAHCLTSPHLPEEYRDEEITTVLNRNRGGRRYPSGPTDRTIPER